MKYKNDIIVFILAIIVLIGSVIMLVKECI
jgi:hypothetical protein